MHKNLKGALIATAVAGLFVANQAFAGEGQDHGAGDGIKCMGANACKGQGACAVKGGHSCAGENACKGKGWIKTKDAKECESKGGKVMTD